MVSKTRPDAAGNRKEDAGNLLRIITGEEGRRGGDLLGPPNPLQHVAIHLVLELRVLDAIKDARGDEPGRDAIDPDFRRKF